MTATLPLFRNDLELTPRIAGTGQFRYLVKDHRSDALFELSEEDYFICKHFDGQTFFEEVQTAFQIQFNRTLPLKQLEAYVRYLERLNLTEHSGEDQEDTSRGSREPLKVRRIGDPDRFFRKLADFFGWCFSPVFLVLLAVPLFLATGILVNYGSDLLYDFFTLWETGHYLLFVVLGVLSFNFLSEVAKGIACKYCGGSVYELGFWAVFNIFPRFYCDLSDVSWMPRKSKRLRIVSAGILVQLFALSISIIMWGKAVPLTTMSTFWLVLAVICLWALFLNVNPLLSRDGYYLLITLLEVPGLRSRAFFAARAWLLREPLPEPLTDLEALALRWYSLLSISFAILLTLGILGLFGYILIRNLEGFGACLFLFILFRFARNLKRQRVLAPESLGH